MSVIRVEREPGQNGYGYKTEDRGLPQVHVDVHQQLRPGPRGGRANPRTTGRVGDVTDGPAVR